MTDINALIGPDPMPAPSPKFPTPWRTIGDLILAATDEHVMTVDAIGNPGDALIAAFIAEAVNEKIARDQVDPPAPKFSYYSVDPDFGNGPSFYRVRNGAVEVFSDEGEWVESDASDTLKGLRAFWSQYGPVTEITPDLLPPAARP